MNRAGLRTTIPGLLDKAHFGAGPQFLESVAYHAMSMEVDEASILSFDTARIVLGVELADPPMRRLDVALHGAPSFAFVILELAPSGPERITERHVRILVSVVGRTSVSDRDLLIGKRDVDPEVIQPALVLVMRRRLDDDMTAHDVFAEPIEARG
jgi:hypothetical protein